MFCQLDRNGSWYVSQRQEDLHYKNNQISNKFKDLFLPFFQFLLDKFLIISGLTFFDTPVKQCPKFSYVVPRKIVLGIEGMGTSTHFEVTGANFSLDRHFPLTSFYT